MYLVEYSVILGADFAVGTVRKVSILGYPATDEMTSDLVAAERYTAIG